MSPDSLHAATSLDATRGDNTEWEMLTDPFMMVAGLDPLPRGTSTLETRAVTAMEGRLLSLSPNSAAFFQTSQ